jgi:REP element-mobilizing transposase RayT
MDRINFIGKEYKSHRLSGYDYASPGWYFITMCVQDGLEVFGEVRNGIMGLNEFGSIVAKCWYDLPEHYPHCVLDAFVIMPNHVHAIIGIRDVGSVAKHGVSEFIRAWKAFSSRGINELDRSLEFRWQRSFYDRIIHDELGLENVRAYIGNNPKRWGTGNVY